MLCAAGENETGAPVALTPGLNVAIPGENPVAARATDPASEFAAPARGKTLFTFPDSVFVAPLVALFSKFIILFCRY
jgi:hypothetical protein